MPVTFVAAGATTDAQQVNKPAGLVVGDVMIAAVANREARTDSTIGGWTKVAQPFSAPGNSTSMGVFWKAWSAADPASWAVVTGGGASAYRTTVLGYRGVSTTDPVEVFSTSFGHSDSPTWPSVTVADSELVVGAVSLIQSSITGPAGTTERWPLVVPASGEVTGWAFEKAVTAGATGAFVATTLPGGTSNGWATVLLALRPGGPQWTVGRGDFGDRVGFWN